MNAYTPSSAYTPSIPAHTHFVERLPELTKKGEHRTKGHHHYWAPCDACGVGMLLPDDSLKVKWVCPTCRRTSTRQASPELPTCEGRKVDGEMVSHEAIEMATNDPRPGRPCRMTPRCEGHHRKEEM